MAVYYGIALAARACMRKVVGLAPSFPQFWWEGIPPLRKNAAA